MLKLGRRFLSNDSVNALNKKRQQELMARGLPKKRQIENVKNVILVASGKGGVGKSTTAVNLAAVFSFGFKKKVGIFDADVYGPSIPIMMNLTGQDTPLVDDQNKMIPLENYGIECMSMGFLVRETDALVWRGPMVMGAIEKMAHGTRWSDNLDILIIDMPPGTGDIHLSISQTIQVSGAIIVSTPQKVALADAKKGVKMFEKVQIPVFGLVENMAAFSCPKCNEVTHIFGQKSDLIEGIPTLGSVPLEAEIMRSSDNGAPIFITNPDSNAAKIYKNIAEQILNAM